MWPFLFMRTFLQNRNSDKLLYRCLFSRLFPQKVIPKAHWEQKWKEKKMCTTGLCSKELLSGVLTTADVTRRRSSFRHCVPLVCRDFTLCCQSPAGPAQLSGKAALTPRLRSRDASGSPAVRVCRRLNPHGSSSSKGSVDVRVSWGGPGHVFVQFL